ncbi:hypothetical protein [Acidovorax sp. Leaf78]|uniref:hypothetical protein n=1 Tax=Acidovorax sp. Leaf78 TaxID=1736237 RepID=UPI0006FB308C|nr:hypothetical protein [Acidovorax sp. Leaf78]KQO15587.1 hypothetical protein ASF16_16760 [Acidovorax sp. Leaf78]
MKLYTTLLPPLWTTIAVAVATLATNWIWASWFLKAKGTGLAVLLIYSIFGWPLMLAVIYLALGYSLRLCEGLSWLRMAIVLAAIGAGWAVYGMPGPWNLLLCIALTIPVALQSRRTAQDDADLEHL